MTKVVMCVPTVSRPFQQCLDAIEKAVPALDAAGIEHSIVFTIGSPYISHARADMTRKALDAKADVIIFIDHDVSFDPQDLVALINTGGEVVGGTYRFKKPEEVYMGIIATHGDFTPIVRDDGCIKATALPAGFLKVTRAGLERFAKSHPHLLYGSPLNPWLDLFNHGAHEGVWWGEDYAFCRNYRAAGGEIWLIPNLNINHHGKVENADKTLSDIEYKGNFDLFLRKQPGGDLDPNLTSEEREIRISAINHKE